MIPTFNVPSFLAVSALFATMPLPLQGAEAQTAPSAPATSSQPVPAPALDVAIPPAREPLPNSVTTMTPEELDRQAMAGAGGDSVETPVPFRGGNAPMVARTAGDSGAGYADLADLILGAPVIVDGVIRSATRIKGVEAASVAPASPVSTSSSTSPR